MITVVMNTNGLRPKRIETAIQSVLDQTYEDFILQITCIHSDGLHLNCKDPRIVINNLSKFPSFPKQIVWSLKQVKTPFWCIIDSDDYVLPEHLEVRVKYIPKTKYLQPKSIETKYALYQEDKKQVTLIKYAWQRCLFNKINESYIDAALAKYLLAGGVENRFDSTIRKLDCWDHIEIPEFATYLYRYTSGYHVSRENPKKRLNMPITRLPILTPRHHKNLEDVCRRALK